MKYMYFSSNTFFREGVVHRYGGTVYRDRRRTMHDLRAAITAFIQSISSEQLTGVFKKNKDPSLY